MGNYERCRSHYREMAYTPSDPNNGRRVVIRCKLVDGHERMHRANAYQLNPELYPASWVQSGNDWYWSTSDQLEWSEIDREWLNGWEIRDREYQREQERRMAQRADRFTVTENAETRRLWDPMSEYFTIHLSSNGDETTRIIYGT